MNNNESQPPQPGRPLAGWVIPLLLTLPTIVSVLGVYVSQDSYGSGGLIGLVIVAPIVSTIATGLLAKDWSRRGEVMSPLLCLLSFLGLMIVSTTLSYGCCASLGQIG